MLALRVLDDDLADRTLDEDDKGDDGDGHQEHADDQECGQRARPAELERAGDCRGHLGHNAGENDQRDAVADAAACDLLAKPHQEQRATDKGGYRRNPEEHARIADNTRG